MEVFEHSMDYIDRTSELVSKVVVKLLFLGGLTCLTQLSIFLMSEMLIILPALRVPCFRS